MSAETQWKTLAEAHRTRQHGNIPTSWQLNAELINQLRGVGTPAEGKLIELDIVRKSGALDDRQLAITECFTATQLLDKIHQGDFTSQEVTTAFCKRAALAQQFTSCLTEIFFEEGIERAKRLDTHLKETGKPIGPLHGLPISLKDSFIVEGHYATVGYVEFLKQPTPQSSSALVRLLLDAGAVLYCKTNVPQTMMTADSENNIFGRTLNPHNTNLTAGGSSGGEGALVAFRGSILGVGTDIAGSVRIPSLCCGIYGFKPTIDRVPFAWQSSYPFPFNKIPGLTASAGPMATSVDDLVLFMELALGQRPWKYDASALDIPWRKLNPGGRQDKLVIGIMPEDPDYPLHPPVRRSIERAILILEKAGHRLVHLPHDPQRSPGLGCRIGYQFFTMADAASQKRFHELGEPPVTSVERGVHPFSSGNFPVSPTSELSCLLSDLNKARIAYAEGWQKVWIDNRLDVVLGPAATSTAVQHDSYGVPLYTLMWNVLDYPAGIIPFGFVTQENRPKYQKAQAAFDPDFDEEVITGAPCALQVIAPRLRDEECLEAMRMIDEILRSSE